MSKLVFAEKSECFLCVSSLSIIRMVLVFDVRLAASFKNEGELDAGVDCN